MRLTPGLPLVAALLLSACGGSDKPGDAPAVTGAAESPGRPGGNAAYDGGADTAATAPDAAPGAGNNAITQAQAEQRQPIPEPSEAGGIGAAGGTAASFSSLIGDAKRGATVFAQCRACHVVEPGKNRIGPSLHAVVGRPAGTVAGFTYSKANKDSGITWSEDNLFRYLEAPQKFIPGTKMAFGGLKKAQDRADVIAYLKTQA